jgi:hypothetical protein
MKLLEYRNVPDPSYKPSSEDESNAEMINAAKSLVWEAEHYLPSDQMDELIWMRSSLDSIFRDRSKKFHSRFMAIYQEITRCLESPPQVRQLVKGVEEKLRYADHIADLARV